MRAIIGVILLILSPLALTNLVENTKIRNLLDQDQAPKFLTVDDAFKVETEFYQGNSLRFYWQIAEDYYLYKNKFKADLIYNDQIFPLRIGFPPAITRTDEYFGEVEVYYDTADLRIDLIAIKNKVYTIKDNISLRILSQGCADAGLCYAVRKDWFKIDFLTQAIQKGEPSVLDHTRILNNSSNNPEVSSNHFFSLLMMLIFAFIGGIILNFMPCIFPILSLKILSFSASKENVKSEAWSYAAGIIFSFVIVASILITIQSAGKAIGWGFQLQSPTFVTALAYLFLILGLSLSGVIQMGTNLMGTGDSLTKKSGLLGSFFTGVLAVVIASPCSAPFMGTALGFAITQVPIIAISIFIALGAGMAAPLVILAYNEAIRKRMPSPGKWMETLKQFLAFPLYASAIWLFWVVGSMLGVNAMSILLSGGLMITFGFWLTNKSGFYKSLGAGFLIVGILGGTISAQSFTYSSSKINKEGTEIWSEERLSRLRKEGKPVFVDVTAKWCITCIANETAVLYTDQMLEEFRRRDVTYLVADWTTYEPNIARFIEEHGRTGIPLYLFYPAGSSNPPIMLPQILTFSKVLAVLDSEDRRR